MQHDFILLDRSGSMGHHNKWTEALGAINGYVKGLAEKKVDTGVTLVCFDKQAGDMSYDIVRERIVPTSWYDVRDGEIVDGQVLQPRGMTPLNDAIGRLVAGARDGGYDKVAIIIVTDGLENASREITVIQAKKMLDECRARGWQVIFLGADFDNVMQAASYGNMRGQTVSMAAGNFMAATASMADKRALYSNSGVTMDWNPVEQEKLEKKKESKS